MDGYTQRLLFGTDEPPAPSQRLVAGPLSAEFEGGNMHSIRYGGVEIIRAISFLVRSPRWATYEAEIGNLVVDQGAAAFSVTYTATVRDGAAELRYAARIEGRDDSLTFACDIDAVSDFETCRTGFVVLHAADLAGRAVQVEHADATRRETRFPLLIDPVQPLLNLRALTHEAAPGVVVTCRMDGEVFEMEDQRNWTDASFKTYVRPLSRPWPYMLPAGSRSTQAVSLSVRGAAPVAGDDAGEPTRIDLGERLGTMPPIGLGCTPQEARDGLPLAGLLARAGIAVLVCRFDPGLGHAAADMQAFAALALAIGAAVELQLVVHSIGAFVAELQQAAQAMREAGLTPLRIAVSPAPDLKSTTPGQPWPDCAPLDRLYQAARAAFPGIELAGGTFAYFTELNRKRPPLELLDAVTFSTSALVHAADDRSVMQSLQALPAVAASARAFAGARPLLVGPSAIGFRDNPYGAAPLPNPDGVRLPMSGADPRQRGLFNAAWTLGHIAAFAAAGVARIAVAGPVGAHGIADAAGPFPVFAVLQGLAALRGATLHAVRSSRPDRCAALLASLPGRRELWLANTTAAAQTFELPQDFVDTTAYRLDADTLQTGSAGRMASMPVGRLVQCGAYAVLRCVATA